MSKTDIQKNQKNTAGAFIDKYSYKAGLLLIAITWPIITLCLKPFIERLGDLSLFIYNTEFFNQKVFTPAGTLDYICSFLNQLLFTPWLAALLLITLWLAAYALAVRLFELKKSHTILALVPIALLLCTITGYGRNIYFLSNQNIFYTSTIGYLFALCIATCSKKCSKCLTCKLVTIAIAGTAGYLIAGTYALLGLAITAVMSIADKNASIAGKDAQIADRLAVAGCAILVILVFPLYFCKHYIAGIEFVNFTTYNCCNIVPFILLAIYTILLAFSKQLNDKKTVLEFSCAIAASVLAIILTNGVDRQFATELKMFQALEKENFEKVLEMYDDYAGKCISANKKSYISLKKSISGQKRTKQADILSGYYRDTYKTPSRIMSQFRLIALGRTGQIGSKLFSSMTGEIDRSSKLSYSTMLFEYGPTFFNNWGVFSSAYVWASGNSIHSGWNYYNLKESVIALMLKGDNELAGKYIDILCSTKVYRKWAEEQKQYIQTGTAATNSKYRYMQALDCPRENQYISSSRDIESFLVHHFALWDKQPEKITPEYAECAMLWSIYSQQIPEFWTAFNKYMEITDATHIPRYYQEAAYMYATLEQPALLEIFPFDKEIANTYKDFDRFAQKNRQLTAVEMRNECFKKFGSTFFYFYFFVRNFL